MDMMFAVQLLFRWIHIFGAIILVGGVIFQYCVVRPSATSSLEPVSEQAAAALRGRWRTLVMLSITMLLVSGFVNLFIILW